jgi:hypothetical protein
MSDAPTADFRIYPDWKDVMVYDEGDGRVLRLECDSLGGDQFQVSVPSVDCWSEETPVWAHEKRNLILARLRAARCNLCEVGQFIRTLFSPDGRFRVEIYYEPEPPFRPREEIRVLGDQGLEARFPAAGVAGVISFPSPGMVIIPYNVDGRRYQVGINTIDRTFWFPTHEDPQALENLPAVLAAQMPVRVPVSIRPKFPLAVLWEFPTCLIAVGGGIWQMIDGKTTKDHVLGAVCAIFFGACFTVPMGELRRWRNPPSPPPPTGGDGIPER